MMQNVSEVGYVWLHATDTPTSSVISTYFVTYLLRLQTFAMSDNFVRETSRGQHGSLSMYNLTALSPLNHESMDGKIWSISL